MFSIKNGAIKICRILKKKKKNYIFNLQIIIKYIFFFKWGTTFCYIDAESFGIFDIINKIGIGIECCESQEQMKKSEILSHNLIELSFDPLNMRLPSGEKKTELTDLERPSNAFNKEPELLSHNCMELLYDPLNMRIVSGEKKTEGT